MAYTLEQFCTDCRAILKTAQDNAAREAIRSSLERLLANRDFVAAHCEAGATPGVTTLFHDPETDVHVLCHVYDKPRKSPPHDHGASWAIYGQAVLHTDMTDWQRTDRKVGPEKDRDEVEPVRRYRLDPGKVGVYHPGMVHSIDYPAGARFIRVTGTNLDLIPRGAYVAAEKVAVQA